MPAIIPRILKTPCGKDQSYQLKYSDLESSLAGLSSENIYISVYFTPNQAYWLEERREHQVTGTYQLVDATYEPDPQVLARTYITPVPWDAVPRPIVVSMRVLAVPASVSGLLKRAALRNLLREHVAALCPDGLPGERWRVRLTLRANARQLVSELWRWRGLRQLGQTTQLLDLAPPLPEDC